MSTEYHEDEAGPQWTTKRTRRRGPVLCDAGCGSDIRTGEKYVEIRGVWDGRWDLVRLHTACHEQLTRQSEEAGEAIEFHMISEYARVDGYVWFPTAHEWRPA